MATQALSAAPEGRGEQAQHGFDAGLSAIVESASENAQLLSHEFGSIEGLRKACNDCILEIDLYSEIGVTAIDVATNLVRSADANRVVRAYDELPLVRSMLSARDLGRALIARVIHNAKACLEDAVRGGTNRTSRDPKTRAAFVAMSGGGFLLYWHMHDNPNDMEAALRNYSKDMIPPALELYTHGLATNTSIYDAFVAREEAREGHAAE